MNKSISSSLLILQLLSLPLYFYIFANAQQNNNQTVETLEQLIDRATNNELPRLHQQLKSLEGADPRDNKQIEKLLLEIGNLYREIGQPAKVAETYNKLLGIQKTLYGEDAKEWIPIFAELASAYQLLNKYDDSIGAYHRLIIICKDHYGEDSVEIVKYLVGCATAMRNAKRNDEANTYEKKAGQILLTNNVPLKLSSGLMVATAKHREEPKYPNPHLQGSVVVKVLVNVKGNVIDATIINGVDGLNELAIEAARKWRFQRYTLGGISINRETVLTFNFAGRL